MIDCTCPDVKPEFMSRLISCNCKDCDIDLLEKDGLTVAVCKKCDNIKWRQI